MADQHHHRHGEPESEMTLRVRAIEQLLAEKGLVDPTAIDRLVELYETRVGPHNGARVVARAWSDPAYKARLLENGTDAIAELGIMNILKHAGVVAGAPDIPRPSRLIHTLSGKAFVTAKTEGLFEICRELGETVKTGDVIARVHYLEDPEREPTPLIAACDGQIVCRHVPGLIHRGDCAAVIAEAWPGDA